MTIAEARAAAPSAHSSVGLSPRRPARLQLRRGRAAVKSRRRARQQAGLHRRARRYHLCAACRPGGALFHRAARPRAAPRGARAHGAHRHCGLADRVSRLPENRHRRRSAEHAAHRRRLPLHARRQPRPLPGGVGSAAAEVRQYHQGQSRARARHRFRRQPARLPPVRGRDRRRRAGGLHRADQGRRYRLLALHLGLDRHAERRGACACQPEIDRRSLRHAGCGDEGKRRRLFGGQAVLRLRPRQRHDLPDVGRRHHRTQRREADARRRRRAAAQASGHDVLRRADVLCRVLGEPERAAEIRAENPPLRLRR